MIRKDLTVIEILMKRKARLYRDLGQSSPNRRNRKFKSPETRSRKAFFDFQCYGVVSLFSNKYFEGLKIYFSVNVISRKTAYINRKKTRVAEQS